MLVLDDVRFSYPDQTTQYVFEARVEPGQIVAISGPSGCGKSTLLNLVAGFVTPQSGHISLDGTDLTHLPPEARDVSILFQAENLFEHLTAAGNLELALPASLKQEKHTKIAKALSSVGLEGYQRRRADKLSGGQKQRLALARTLLLGRPVLLLDEPFSALDATTAQSVRDLVRDLVSTQKWHTLMVSHDKEDLAIADRQLTMHEGRLQRAPAG